MLHAVDRLTGTNAVGVVGVGITVKGLELPPLFPSQGVTQIGGRIPLGIVGNGLTVVSRQFILPDIVAIGIDLAVLGQDVAVAVVGHGVDHNAVHRLRQELTKGIVGILGSAGDRPVIALPRLGDRSDSLLRIVGIGQGMTIGKDDLADQIGGGRRLGTAETAIILAGVLRGDLTVEILEPAENADKPGLNLVKLLPTEGIILRMAGVNLFPVLHLQHHIAVFTVLIVGVLPVESISRKGVLADQVAFVIVVITDGVHKSLASHIAIGDGNITLRGTDNTTLLLIIVYLLWE